MKCPYRKIIRYTYSVTLRADGEVVIHDEERCPPNKADTVTEEYPDCYGDECPHYENGWATCGKTS